MLQLLCDTAWMVYLICLPKVVKPRSTYQADLWLGETYQAEHLCLYMLQLLNIYTTYLKPVNTQIIVKHRKDPDPLVFVQTQSMATLKLMWVVTGK